MTPTTQRPLDAIATPEGVLSVLALDHRDAMRNVFTRAGLDASDTSMVEFKARVMEALGVSASAVILDSVAVESCRPVQLGLIVPLEEQGHVPLEGGRLTPLIEDFGPAEAAALSADACKLLLWYRADHPETAGPQLELLRDVAQSCHSYGLPLVLEPIVYRLDGEDPGEYADRLGELVVAAASDTARTGVDLLKLQFPGEAETCEQVTEVAGALDWAVLGGRDTGGETFAEQLQVACRAGACGFMAGRAVWAGAVVLPEAAQPAWLRSEALPLFDRLADIAHTHARRIR